MDEIILIGAGGHARVCIDIIEMLGEFKVAGLVEKDITNIQKENFAYPIIGTDDDLHVFRKKYNYALITVGQIKNPEIRTKLFKQLQKMNYI